MRSDPKDRVSEPEEKLSDKYKKVRLSHLLMLRQPYFMLCVRLFTGCKFC